MPALNNARWEMYCTGIAQGKNQMQSYKDAGFSSEGQGNATTLSKRPEIKARVAELIEERTQFRANYTQNGNLEHLGEIENMLETGEVDRRWVMKHLMDNVRDAREAGQFSASNKALEMLGKEIGMFQEKGKKADDDEGKKALPPPVSVENINLLLDSVGYKGPPIDLTSIALPALTGEKTHGNSKSARS